MRILNAPEDARLHGNLFNAKDEAVSPQQQNSGISAKKVEIEQEPLPFDISRLNSNSEENDNDVWKGIMAESEKLKELYRNFDPMKDNIDDWDKGSKKMRWEKLIK